LCCFGDDGLRLRRSGLGRSLVLSIVGMLALGALASGTAGGRASELLVAITWSTAGSLILTGPVQLVFGAVRRRLQLRGAPELILPNLLGALQLTTAVSGVIASVVVFLGFHESIACSALLVATFVAFCDGWLLLVLLSGVRTQLRGRGRVLRGATRLRRRCTGAARRRARRAAPRLPHRSSRCGVRDAHPRDPRVPRRARDPLRLPASEPRPPPACRIGLLFYVGTWVDKAVFWFSPSTSTQAIGPLRTSALYDLPIFLAYLSAIPAMAAFFLRLEADFAQRCSAFVNAVRDGAPLHRIERIHAGMVTSVRRGFGEILQVQGVTLVTILVAGPALLRAAGISPLHLRLLLVDSVAVALQVMFLAILNVLFYLDQRRPALVLIALFAAGNFVFTLVTQALGPDWFGFGFASAALLASAAGLPVLSRKLERLDREIFMRQPLWPGSRRPSRTPTGTPSSAPSHAVPSRRDS